MGIDIIDKKMNLPIEYIHVVKKSTYSPEITNILFTYLRVILIFDYSTYSGCSPN